MPATARPTSGRARGALFDVLGARVEGARVLDLYAGSGAVGLEAVSRGAASAVLVEPEPGGKALARAVAAWGAGEAEVRVLAEPAARAIRRLEADAERFDVVFADPPYARGELPAELAGVRALLAEGGVLIVQADADSPVPNLPGLAASVKRAYGRNVFHFLGLL